MEWSWLQHFCLTSRSRFSSDIIFRRWCHKRLCAAKAAVRSERRAVAGLFDHLGARASRVGGTVRGPGTREPVFLKGKGVRGSREGNFFVPKRGLELRNSRNSAKEYIRTRFGSVASSDVRLECTWSQQFMRQAMKSENRQPFEVQSYVGRSRHPSD